jgi:transposase
MTFSDDMRWRVVWKCFEGLTQEEIASHLMISQSTVSNIWKFYQSFGHVTSLGGQGRQPALDAAGLRALDTLVKCQPVCFLDEYCDNLSDLVGFLVSMSTLCRALQKLGITRKRLEMQARKARLSQELEYAYRIGHYDVDQLVFADEVSSDDRSLNRDYGWSLKGRRAHARGYFLRGVRYVHAHARAHARTHTHKHTNTHTHTHTHTQTHTNKHTHTHTDTHRGRERESHMHTHACRHSSFGMLSRDGIIGVDTIQGSYTAATLVELCRTLIIPSMNPFPARKWVSRYF